MLIDVIAFFRLSAVAELIDRYLSEMVSRWDHCQLFSPFDVVQRLIPGNIGGESRHLNFPQHASIDERAVSRNWQVIDQNPSPLIMFKWGMRDMVICSESICYYTACWEAVNESLILLSCDDTVVPGGQRNSRRSHHWHSQPGLAVQPYLCDYYCYSCHYLSWKEDAGSLGQLAGDDP